MLLTNFCISESSIGSIQSIQRYENECWDATLTKRLSSNLDNYLLTDRLNKSILSAILVAGRSLERTYIFVNSTSNAP